MWVSWEPVLRMHGIDFRKTKSNRYYVRCPFHLERTASMLLYPDGGWHCYGCHAGGETIEEYLRKFLDLSEDTPLEEILLAARRAVFDPRQLELPLDDEIRLPF
jgi:DNA primase